VFGRAICAIARISDEFWFDPTEKGLALRSVNSSRSAYACVFFSSMFFQHYCWTAVSQPRQKEKQLSLPCKLIIKSVLPVFRCVHVLQRNVEKCSIYTNIKDHYITFQLLCKHGVVKTYNLTFQECDPLQAVFAKHLCPNILKVHSRLLAEIMIHFPTSQEEVTLSVTPLTVCFKSYTEEDTDFSKTMLTEIQLSPDEFDYFQVGVDSEVTFCLKELRGLLAFSEAASVPVSIHFDASGKPIAFSIEDMVLEASFILATLSAAEEEPASPQPPCFSPWQDRFRTNSSASSTAIEISATESTPCSLLLSCISTGLCCITDLTHSVPPSSKTWTGDSEQPPAGGGSRAAAVASRKPQGNRNALNRGSAKPAIANFYKHCIFQFNSLFFGAVSCKEKDAIGHTLCSLATASDSEEDFGHVQSSQV
ncbi:Cell cycle checkpoint control protein RAD9B, partial [Opisthocomus hoazin]